MKSFTKGANKKVVVAEKHEDIAKQVEEQPTESTTPKVIKKTKKAAATKVEADKPTQENRAKSSKVEK